MNLFRRLFSQEKEAANLPRPRRKSPKLDKHGRDRHSAVTRPILGISYGDGATRPLPEDALIAFMGNGHLTFGQATDIGMVRNNNQDSAYSFFSTSRSVDERPDFGLFWSPMAWAGITTAKKPRR